MYGSWHCLALALVLAVLWPAGARAEPWCFLYADPHSHQAMIGVRDLAAILGLQVRWQQATREVELESFGQPVVRLNVREGTLEGVPLEPRPQISGGVTYVPLRKVAEALKATVTWQNGTMTVQPVTAPPVTLRFPALIGSYTITFSQREAQGPNFANARTAGYKINGMIIPAGEVMSFNQAVGHRTADRGFIPGVIFVGRSTAWEVGGGVCRVATLLHNAVVAAGLEVVERHQHSLPVGYVPRGRDATVNDGVLDYRFRNSSGAPVRLEFASQGPSLTLKIWQLR